MGQSCCESKVEDIEKLRRIQGSTLRWVLFINVLMFIIEFVFGALSRSSALMADSLDMLGDAAVYGFSLYVLHRGPVWRARAGYIKGLLMAALGIVVFGQTIYHLIMATLPNAQTMGIIGALALLANLVCLIMLYKHRSDDINMKSTWICSRNDIIANVSVLISSFLVSITQSGIPDIIVGFTISVLFLKSALGVLLEASKELSDQ